MRPIFTIHAGEYLVGSYLEETLKDCRVWVPSKDTGIDLLVTSNDCKKTVALQVKSSKDYSKDPKYKQDALKFFGWFQFDKKSLEKSPADFWSFVLIDPINRNREHIWIKPRDLYSKLGYHSDTETYNIYFGVTNKNKCWETRNLNKKEKENIITQTYISEDRDFTAFLNIGPIKEALGL